MDSKIQELAQKLLQEGVEKGNEEAARIVADAKEEAARINDEACAKAAMIVAKAEKSARLLDAHTRSELKMYMAQALGALKTEIADVVCARSVEDAVGKMAADEGFMREFVLRLAEKWGAREDIVIGTPDAEALKSLFAKKAKALLDKGVRIEHVNGRKVSFTVRPADGAYKVEFGEAEFEAYFKAFLRPQLVEMLF